MSIIELLKGLTEPLILAVGATLLAPILRLFDENRRRAEFRNKLQDLKLLAEVNSVLPGRNSEVFEEAFSKRYNDILQRSPYAVALVGTGVSEQELRKLKTKFRGIDFISAVIFPISVSVIAIATKYSEFHAMWIGISLFACIISLLLSIYIVCPRVERPLPRLTLLVVTGIFSVVIIFACLYYIYRD